MDRVFMTLKRKPEPGDMLTLKSEFRVAICIDTLSDTAHEFGAFHYTCNLDYPVLCLNVNDTITTGRYVQILMQDEKQRTITRHVQDGFLEVLWERH